ncbi:hypothetical protein GCM10018953_18130 [Streptosporangium nondiastaticum]
MEIAIMERGDWCNNRRLYSACGDHPLAEFEALYRPDSGPAILAGAS